MVWASVLRWQAQVAAIPGLTRWVAIRWGVPVVAVEPVLLGLVPVQFWFSCAMVFCVVSRWVYYLADDDSFDRNANMTLGSRQLQVELVREALSSVAQCRRVALSR